MMTYNQFIDEVERLGAMAFYGKFVPGLPSIQDYARDEQWHTGDPDTDPWLWKDRVAHEHRLAFGNLLGRRKGFISKTMYPLFYRACRPDYAPQERFRRGELQRTVLEVYELFDLRFELSTAEIREMMGVKKTQGTAPVDRAIVQLQNEYLITVCGNQRRVKADGSEYGWPSNTYCKAEIWAGDWLGGHDTIDRAEARRQIIERCAGWGTGIDPAKLHKALFGA